MKQGYSTVLFPGGKVYKTSVNVYASLTDRCTHVLGIRYPDRQAAIHGRGANCLYRINVKPKPDQRRLCA